jgi:hypothetical protein
MDQRKLEKGLHVYEIGLWIRIGAIVLAMGLPIFMKDPAMVVITIWIGFATEGLATGVMTAGAAMLARVPGPARGALVAALVFHLIVLGVILYDIVWTTTTGAQAAMTMDRELGRAIADRRHLLDLVQYGAAVLGMIAMLVATSRLARQVGHEMFGDRALGLIKIAVILGVLMLAFWWWTGKPRAFAALYGATLGLRVVATIVIALYIGVLRQLRRLVRDPEAAAPSL